MNRPLLVATVCLLAVGCSKPPPPAPPPPVAVKPAPTPAPVAPAPPPPLAWQSLETPTFTVEVPGSAEAKEGTEQTKAGPVKTTTWSVKTPGAFFAVSTADYPKGSMGALPGKVLDGARDGAMANVKGTVEKDSSVTLDSGNPKKPYPGREFTGSTPQGIKVAARLFIVDDRLYQMISVSPTAAFSEADFQKFADSFKLKSTAKAGKPAKRPKK